MNKRQQSILDAYNNSDLRTLHECYGSWSWAKEYAYEDCKRTCANMNGYDFRIISYNTCMFSIGFRYKKDGKEYLHYETNVSVLDFEIGKGDAYGYDDFKQDYDALSDKTKEHLANSGVQVHSMQEAKDLMKISTMFDLLFNM